MKFSQRIGASPSTKTIQVEDIDSELRNGLWNALKLYFFDPIGEYNGYYYDDVFGFFCQVLWLNFYKLPIDIIPNNHDRESYIRERFFQFKWFEVYDFLEFVANLHPQTIKFDSNKLKEFCNKILERENAGYRFIDDNIAPITNSTENNEIEEAINSTGHFTALSGANVHLKNSLDKISDKKSPDYRNSIKESISAVESVAKKISDNKNDTLAGALDKIKGKIKIHPALEKGFKQIYGYTSDTDGIRHALTEETNCDFEDAKFMLVSCSAFINYLITKANKNGIKLDK
jgi:AbiJ N-terminal domain 4